MALFIIAQNLGDHISRSIASFRRDHAMDLDRRDACLLTLAAAGVTVFDPAIAQQPVGFDPVAFAKLRAGEIAREIANSPRDVSVPEPARDTVFMTGLLLQAGLRAFLPVSQRQGVALAGSAGTDGSAESGRSSGKLSHRVRIRQGSDGGPEAHRPQGHRPCPAAIGTAGIQIAGRGDCELDQGSTRRTVSSRSLMAGGPCRCGWLIWPMRSSR